MNRALVRTLAGVVLLTATFAGAARAAPISLVPGDVYAVVQGGVRQYDPSLHEVATFSLPGAGVTEGVAFTPAGHLVFSAYQNGTHHVVEIDAAGGVVHNLDLRIGSLDRASHIDVDAAGRLYVASTPNLLEVAADLSSFRVLPHGFARSSGVAVGPDDRVYATDQAANRLVIFGPGRAEAADVGGFGLTPTGLAFGPAGQLFAATEYEAGRLDRVNPATGARSAVLTGLAGLSDVAFAADGSYYVVAASGDRLQHRSAANAVLQSISTGEFSDSIAVMVPEPAAVVPLATAFMALVCRPRARRRPVPSR